MFFAIIFTSLSEFYERSSGITYSDENMYEILNCTNSLSRLTVKRDVRDIQFNAFDKSRLTLKSITFAKYSEMRKIRKGLFYDFPILSSVDMSYCEHLSIISEIAFGSCISLEKIKLPKSGLKFIEAGCFSYTKISSIILPSSLERIEPSQTKIPGAFEGCKSLAQITFEPPSELTYIGQRSFVGTAIEEFRISDKVEKIGSYCFLNCTSLKKITVSQSNMYYKVSDGVLLNPTKTSLYFAIPSQSLSLPSNLQIIDAGALVNTVVNSLTIPEGIFEIGERAFAYSNFVQCKLPATLTQIRKGAFFGCENLQKIEFPPGIAVIPEDCFLNCKSIESFNVLDTVVSIENRAFMNCSSLYQLSGCSKVSKIGKKSFMSCALHYFSIPKDVYTIGNAAFGFCKTLTSIDVDMRNTHFISKGGCIYTKDGSTLIVAAAGRERTTFVKNGCIRISEGAFMGSSTKSVRLPSTVTRLENKAFSRAKLFDINIPESVNYLGSSLFRNSSNLIAISIPSSIQTIPEKCFYGCHRLRLAEIEHVKRIESKAFACCSDLITIRMSSNPIFVGADAFADGPPNRCGISDKIPNLGFIGAFPNQTISCLVY